MGGPVGDMRPIGVPAADMPNNKKEDTDEDEIGNPKKKKDGMDAIHWEI